MLKRGHENPNKRSAHYKKQPPFHGSNRQARGTILAFLIRKLSVSEREIVQYLRIDQEKVKKSLAQLTKEGFVKKKQGRFSIV